jgi:transposase
LSRIGSCSKLLRTAKSDITLLALCDRLLTERRVKADTSMMSRFFRRIGVTRLTPPEA